MKTIKILQKIAMVISVILLLISIGYILITFITNKTEENKKALENEIKDYNYTLDVSDTSLYKTYFKELSTLLSSKDINYDSYGELISKMFIVDFYTLENKLTKDDVGGTQFIESDTKANFVLAATDTMYKYVVNNLDGKRVQKLPKVISVQVLSKENISYTYQGKTDDNAYKITLSWKYEKDLGYEDSGELILVHDGKKLVIVEKNSI